ncbi:MAG: hypothetical protein ACLGH4_00140 [Actinomycetes bacterium]
MELSTDTAAEVLQQMHGELGDFDPDTRALVGLKVAGEDEVELVDLDVDEAGVLHPPADLAGIVLVTGDAIEVTETEDVTELRQLLCVLPDGHELGVFRLGDDPQLYVWDSDSDDPNVDELRPRDTAANIARRVFGLPAHISDVPITEFLARIELLHLAQVTLELFDGDGGPTVVTPAQVEADGRPGPFAALLAEHGPADDEAEAARRLAAELTWEHVRRLAAKGELVLGPYEFPPAQAAWLDARGFAQAFDETVMSGVEIVQALDTMGDDDLVDWAVGRLLERDWLSPSVALATGDLAAAEQAASGDPRYGA